MFYFHKTRSLKGLSIPEQDPLCPYLGKMVRVYIYIYMAESPGFNLL